MLRLISQTLLAGAVLWIAEAPAQTVHSARPTTTKTQPKTTKTKTTTTTTVRPTSTHAHTTRHTTEHLAAARSRTWLRYHNRHWHSMWDVRFSAASTHARAFADYASAATFSQYLGARHFVHSMSPTSTGWLVAYRTHHFGTYGTYTTTHVAGAVATGLRQLGFTAWLHHRSVYRAF